tara:strand:- start:489 stop:959 length:471 start_codon:yes stop_codon:yes gene_type:complete
MSKTAIQGFYDITEKIKDTLLADANVNTVTTGDLSRLDLSKQTIFPLSHILINSCITQEQVLVFNITILTMDIIDVNKDNNTDLFIGNNNEHDVLNTQLAVINRLIALLRKGNLYLDKYQVIDDPVCEPFYERFENEMVGWATTMDILIENDVSIC